MKMFCYHAVYSIKITKARLIFDENKFDIYVGSNRTCLVNKGFAHFTWAHPFILKVGTGSNKR